ncbi:MAG: MarR family winged helix-turn-helix transcriptional regulator [Akkermansia sp.]
MKERAIPTILKLIVDRNGALFRQYAGELPLTEAQCRVAVYLASKNGEPVSQRQIEAHAGITHPTAKGLLQRMEEKGFVRTAFDSTDKRVKHVYLSELSLDLQEKYGKAVQQVESILLKGFSDEEREQLRSLLNRLYANSQV